MARPRRELEQMLQQLDEQLSRLVRCYPDDVAFWPTFAQHADAVCVVASPDDADWVLQRIDALLMKHGKASLEYLPPP